MKKLALLMIVATGVFSSIGCDKKKDDQGKIAGQCLMNTQACAALARQAGYDVRHGPNGTLIVNGVAVNNGMMQNGPQPVAGVQPPQGVPPLLPPGTFASVREATARLAAASRAMENDPDSANGGVGTSSISAERLAQRALERNSGSGFISTASAPTVNRETSSNEHEDQDSYATD